MARVLVGMGSAMAEWAEIHFIALNLLIFLMCVATVVGLCTGYARHRVLHRESETDGERMELRSGGEGLSSSLQIKRSYFKKSFSFRNSFSRSVKFSNQGNEALENMSNEPTAIWQKVILHGERCVPLSFSGLVLYDEKGNLLPRRGNSYSEDSDQ